MADENETPQVETVPPTGASRSRSCSGSGSCRRELDVPRAIARRAVARAVRVAAVVAAVAAAIVAAAVAVVTTVVADVAATMTVARS